MSFKNNVVFYKKNTETQKWKFNGNGIIIDDYIITAGHVISGDGEFAIQVPGITSIQTLDVKTILYKDTVYASQGQVVEDIAIIYNNYCPTRLKIEFHSAYDPEENRTLTIKGYDVNIESVDICQKSINRDLGTTFKVQFDDKMLEGLSGSPVYLGDKLVGIFISKWHTNNFGKVQSIDRVKEVIQMVTKERSNPNDQY